MKTLRVVMLLALGAQAAAVSAQAPPPREGPKQGREEALKLVDAYVVSNLQESLGLTDEQFVKVLPLVKRLQSDRRALWLRRMQALAELNRTLHAGTATEAGVADQLKELKAVEAEEPGTLKRNRESLDAVLTPLQQAKLRVFEVEVEQKIRQLVGRVSRGGGHRGPRNQGAGDDGADDAP